jgi:hypothetical protein
MNLVLGNEEIFYLNLRNIITELNCDKIVIGGDWNSTWDTSPAHENIDVLNMASIPSRFRSERVQQIATNHNLIDPFRFLYPNKVEYTYVPNAVANNNRSRIDNFLISTNLVDVLRDSVVETGRRTKLFDHRTVKLILGKTLRKHDKEKISNGIIDNPIVAMVVELSVKEAYLNNCNPDTIPRYVVRDLRMEFGRIYSKLKNADTLELELIKNGAGNENVLDMIKNLRSEAKDILETIPDLEFFVNMDLNCTPDFFFEGLIHTLKNEVLSVQSRIYKLKTARKTEIRKEICILKQANPRNFNEIQELERKLDDLIEGDLRDELFLGSRDLP